MNGQKTLPGIREDLLAIREELFDIRHDIHAHPELSLYETRTAGVIRRELEKDGLTWKAVHDTGTVAELKGAAPGPTVILRADIDALPINEKSDYPYRSENENVMHACGHDVHLTALIGAARLLSRYRDSLRGNVRFIFQQAEEFGHGSQFFLNEGYEKGAERIYGFHVSPEAELGKLILSDDVDAASCDYMHIKLYGKGSHISKPHLGNDALLAATEIVTALSKLKNRLNPMDKSLIGIGHLTAGNAWNVVADSAEIEGTVRTLSMDVRSRLLVKIKETVDRSASLYDVKAETEFELFTPTLVNDPDAYKTMYKAASEAVGAENIIKQPVPLGFGGDDFAAFSQTVKGCFIHVGTGTEERPDSKVPLHSDNIYIPDEAVLIGSEILVRCALKNLYEGDI